jgi:hypothetical protein
MGPRTKIWSVRSGRSQAANWAADSARPRLQESLADCEHTHLPSSVGMAVVAMEIRRFSYLKQRFASRPGPARFSEKAALAKRTDLWFPICSGCVE